MDEKDEVQLRKELLKCLLDNFKVEGVTEEEKETRKYNFVEDTYNLFLSFKKKLDDKKTNG